MKSGSWYRSWFNSPYYHLLYRNRDQVEAAMFIDNLLKYFAPKKDATFLDLACGKGRHSVYINKKGFQVTGVDLSEFNIKKAKKSETEGLHFDVHDMRHPYREAAFDYVVNLFTSFGYFDSIEDNLEVLKSGNYNLKPKGVFLIDFMNSNVVINGLISESREEIDGVKFEISRSVVDGFIVKKIKVIDQDETHEFEERVRAFAMNDLMGMFQRAGFEVLDTFGDYHLNAFKPNSSERLILIARKTK